MYPLNHFNKHRLILVPSFITVTETSGINVNLGFKDSIFTRIKIKKKCLSLVQFILLYDTDHEHFGSYSTPGTRNE